MNKPRKTLLRKFIFVLCHNFFINKLKLGLYLFVKYFVYILKWWSKPIRILYKMRIDARKKLFYIFYLEKRAYFFFWYKYFRWVFLFSRRSRRNFIFSFILWLKNLFPYFRLIDLISIDYFSWSIIYFKLVWKFLINLFVQLKLVIPNQILPGCLWIYNVLLFIFSLFVSWFLFKHHCLFIVISGFLGYFLCFWRLPSFLKFLASEDYYWRYLKYAPFLFACFNLSLSLAFVEILDTFAILFGEEVVNIVKFEDLNINKQKQESVVQEELVILNAHDKLDRSWNGWLYDLLWNDRSEVKTSILREEITDFSIDMVNPYLKGPDFWDIDVDIDELITPNLDLSDVPDVYSVLDGNHPDVDRKIVKGSRANFVKSIFTEWQLESLHKNPNLFTPDQKAFVHAFDLNRRLEHPDLESANYVYGEWLRIVNILAHLSEHCTDEATFNAYKDTILPSDMERAKIMYNDYHENPEKYIDPLDLVSGSGSGSGSGSDSEI